MNPGIDPIALHIGPWPVYWYGIIFAFVIMLGTYVALKEAEYRGEKAELVWDAVLLVVICGLIGARLYHVIHEWDALYRHNLLGILYLWNGGLAIYGAIIGGFVGIVLFARSAHVQVARWLDIGATGLILGQAIGRWGNFINREQYGQPTELPWAIYVEPQYRVAGYEGFERFQPLFLYESIWNFITFLTLIFLSRSKRVHLKDGDVMLVYLLMYSAGRFVLESIKIGEIWTIMGMRTAQIIAAILIVVCSVLLWYRHRGAKAEAAKPA